MLNAPDVGVQPQVSVGGLSYAASLKKSLKSALIRQNMSTINSLRGSPTDTLFSLSLPNKDRCYHLNKR